jgi:ribosomal-protein-alanine N-acetyltransferase
MTAQATADTKQAMTCIRLMELGDIDQVVVIDHNSFSLPWPASAFRYELLENPSSLLWVAETLGGVIDRQVVGMIVVWYVVDEAHIATLAVDKPYRNQGIAKELLKTALRETIRRGFYIATLEVRAHNLAAQNLYRRFGFEIVGSRPRYYRDNLEDALIMTVKNRFEAVKIIKPKASRAKSSEMYILAMKMKPGNNIDEKTKSVGKLPELDLADDVE